ncbi:MAG: DedA family protein [Dehalococcoidia bacterium]|nr:DedA family protein [Dehalococcoidia bacterium]
MHEIEAVLLEFIRDTYNFMGWPGVILLMAIESASIPLPSELVMPLSGWMLIKEKGLPVAYVLLAGFYGAVGCTIGSLLSYWIGAIGGRPILERYGQYVLITRRDLERADHWFEKYGEATTFVSRLLPVVRTFISVPAGIARMNLVKFTFYTFVGSFIWCVPLAYGGYVLGDHWERIREVMRPFDIPIILVILVLAALYIRHRIKEVRAERVG